MAAGATRVAAATAERAGDRARGQPTRDAAAPAAGRPFVASSPQLTELRHPPLSALAAAPARLAGRRRRAGDGALQLGLLRHAGRAGPSAACSRISANARSMRRPHVLLLAVSEQPAPIAAGVGEMIQVELEHSIAAIPAPAASRRQSSMRCSTCSAGARARRRWPSVRSRITGLREDRRSASMNARVPRSGVAASEQTTRIARGRFRPPPPRRGCVAGRRGCRQAQVPPFDGGASGGQPLAAVDFQAEDSGRTSRADRGCLDDIGVDRLAADVGVFGIDDAGLSRQRHQPAVQADKADVAGVEPISRAGPQHRRDTDE